MPEEEPPARVTTFVLGLTERILLFPASATCTVPEASTATPRGARNKALTPRLLTEPDWVPVPPPPASVVTVLSGRIMRTLWLLASAT